MSDAQLERILDIHTVVRSNERNTRLYRNHKIYSHYENYEMTSADYYFEIHLSQFYRILFFSLELQDRADVWTDKDDTWVGAFRGRSRKDSINCLQRHGLSGVSNDAAK